MSAVSTQGQWIVTDCPPKSGKGADEAMEGKKPAWAAAQAALAAKKASSTQPAAAASTPGYGGYGTYGYPTGAAAAYPYYQGGYGYSQQQEQAKPPLPPPPAGYVPPPPKPPPVSYSGPSYAAMAAPKPAQQQWPWKGGGTQAKVLPVKVSQRTRAVISAAPTPAYTSVKAPAKKKTSADDINSWPASLKSYVMRAYQQCKTDKDRDLVERELKRIIQESVDKNQMDSINWAARPLPMTARVSRITISAPQQPVKATKKKNKKKRGWDQQPGDALALQSRAQRFDLSSSASKPNKRARRRITAPKSDVGGDIDWNQLTIRGTSQSLEKLYLRLTSAPEPSSVRPLHVLVRSLPHVLQRWKSEQKKYKWICDQMKAIRQDLTIQCIRTDFTVHVYETHARIALEHKDNAEFNQCQAQLVALYADGLTGETEEFTSYRVLYYVYTDNFLETTLLMSEISPELQQHPAVRHALDVQSAQMLGNYRRFFALYENAPNMSKYVIDLFIDRERKKACAAMFKAYRPSISTAYVLETLKFRDSKDGMKFLFDLKLPLTAQNAIDCKAASTIMSAMGFK